MDILNPRMVHQIFRGTWVTLVIVMICIVIYYTIPILTPFLIAWLFAYILKPLVQFFNLKLRFPRWLATLVSLLICILTTALLGTLLVLGIIIEINQLTDFLQKNYEDWRSGFFQLIHSTYLQNIYQNITSFYDQNPSLQETINKNISMTTSTLAEFSQSVISFILSTIIRFLTSLTGILVFIIVCLLATFFITKDWPQYKERFTTWLPQKVQGIYFVIKIDLQKALFGYLRAQFILISLTAVFVITGLFILQVKYAILIGLLVGFVDLLPYLGTGAIMVPWILVVFFFQGDIYLGVGLSILYAIIVIVRQIIEPKILASSIGMNPLLILFSMFAGLQIFNFIGLFLGPVIVVMIFSLKRAHVFRYIVTYIKEGRSSTIS
jgi:sporulation integral membrane protein YtvI